MARIRTIKPEFWTSEKVVECPFDTRLLFIGLWNFADDAGIIKVSLKRLKMQIFPADEVDSTSIRRMLDELSATALITEYAIGEDRYLLINGWKDHQRIDKPTYKHPFPNGLIPGSKTEFEQYFDEHSTNVRRAFDERSPPEGKGREGKGALPSQEGGITSNNYIGWPQ